MALWCRLTSKASRRRSGAFEHPARNGTNDVRGDPNITGAIASTNALGVGNGDPSQSGALSMVYVDQWWSGFGEAAGKYLRSISFDASGSSATYGASSTVQPASLRFLACIKF